MPDIQTFETIYSAIVYNLYKIVLKIVKIHVRIQCPRIGAKLSWSNMCYQHPSEPTTVIVDEKGDKNNRKLHLCSFYILMSYSIKITRPALTKIIARVFNNRLYNTEFSSLLKAVRLAIITYIKLYFDLWWIVVSLVIIPHLLILYPLLLFFVWILSSRSMTI